MWYLGVCNFLIVEFFLRFSLLVRVYWRGNINSLNWVLDLIIFMWFFEMKRDRFIWIIGSFKFGR